MMELMKNMGLLKKNMVIFQLADKQTVKIYKLPDFIPIPFLPLLQPACMKLTTVILAVQRLAGVTLDVNLEECIYITFSFTKVNTKGDVTRNQKQMYQWSHYRTSV